MHEKDMPRIGLASRCIFRELIFSFTNTKGIMGREIINDLLPLLPSLDEEPRIPGISEINQETLWILAHYFGVETAEIEMHLEKMQDLDMIEVIEGGHIKIRGAKMAQVCAQHEKKYEEMRQICAKLAHFAGYVLSSSSLIFKGGMGEKEIKEEFAALWTIWPIKKDRPDAYQLYKKLRKSYEREKIEKAVSGYAAFLKTQRLKHNFDQNVKYLKTFLNKERWMEYLEEEFKPPL